MIFFIIIGIVIILSITIYIHLIKKNITIATHVSHIATHVSHGKKYIRLTKDFSNTTNVIQIFQDVFNEYALKETSCIDDADILFFYKLDDYNKFNKCLLKSPKLIYGLNTIDHFCSKSGLYKLLKNYLSPKVLHDVIPISYITNDYESFSKLLNNVHKFLNEDVIFIMKKDLQQQKGLSITNNVDDIKNSYKNKYYIVQHLLQNPYLINGRKINLRIYMLIYIHQQKIHFYRYHDGFMYYTPENFKEKSLELKHNITTGYIDREVYIDNPLTIQDFYIYLRENSSQKLEKNINNLFFYICSCIKKNIIKYENFKECNITHKKFCVFGCDLAIDDTLGVKIMEINKGPDLNFKDEKDRVVKLSMIKDVWEIVNNNKQKNGFLRII